MLIPILWGLGGFALGWLVELLIDYLFWKRRCQNCAEESETRVYGLESKIDGLTTDLSTSNARVGALEGNLNSWERKAGVLAGAGGALGLVGAALNRRDDDFDSEISVIETQLASSSTVESNLDDAQHEIARLKLMQNAPSTTTVTTDVSGLEEEFDDAQHEIARLKLMQNAPSTSTVTTISSTDVSDLQAELDDAHHEIARLKLIQSAPAAAPVVDETELNNYRSRVEELEADLDNSSKLVKQLRTERDEAVELSKKQVVDTKEVDKLGSELDKAQVRIGELEKDLGSSKDMVVTLRTEKDSLDKTYKTQIADFTSKLDSATSETDTKVETVRGELDSARGRVGELEGELKDTRGRVGELEGNLNSARGRVGELEGDLNSARGRIGELENELGDVNNRFKSINVERDQASALVSSLRAEKDDLDVSYKAQIASFTSKLDASSSAESEIGDLRTDLSTSRNRVAELEKALGEANSRIKDANSRIGTANERITELAKERDDIASRLNDELERMRAELKAEQEKVSAIQSERDEAKSFVQSLRGEKDQLEKGYQSQIADFTTQLDSSSGLESELGGLRDDLNNTRGRIGELEGALNGAQDRTAELEKALKASQDRVGALEGQLNDVDNKMGQLSTERDEAKVLITSLRSEKDEIENTYKSQIADFTTKLDENSSTEGELRKLSTELDTMRSRIAELEKQLQAAQNNVSSLTEERDNASKRATSLQTEKDELDTSYKAQIAELTSRLDANSSVESDLTSVRGELDASRNRIAELEKMLGEANSRIKDANSRISDANETINQLVKERDAAINQSSDKLESQQTELQSMQERLTLILSERDEASNLAASLQADKDKTESSYKAQIADLNAKLEASTKAEAEAGKLSSELDATRGRIAELENQLKAAQGNVSSLEKERDQANTLVTSLRVEKDDTEKNYKTQIADFTTQLNASSSTQNELTVLRGNFDSSSKRVAELEKALGEANTRIKDANSRIQTANDNVKSLSSERDSLNKRIAELEAQLKDSGSQAELDAANERLREVESRLAKIPKFKWVKGKDDLQKLRGIGKVMESRLHGAGIMTYSDMAKSTPEKLHEIAEVQAWQDVDTADWITQAKKMKSADEVMILEDGSIVGREGDELRDQINTALYEIERLKAEVKAKPKPPRPKVDKKMQAQLEAAEKKIESLTGSSGGGGRGRRRGRDRLQELDGITAEYEKNLYSAKITSYYEVISATREELIEGAKASKNVKTDVWTKQSNEILAGAKTGRNWLQEIYGVGEEYEARLHAAGVNTYYDVANSTPEELKQIIEADGETPSSASYEDWIQDAENILGNFFHTGFSFASSGSADKDRLSQINGIGKVYEKRLNGAGIYTFAQLSEADPTRVHEVCKIRDWQDHDTAEWIKQAKDLANK